MASLAASSRGLLVLDLISGRLMSLSAGCGASRAYAGEVPCSLAQKVFKMFSGEISAATTAVSRRLPLLRTPLNDPAATSASTLPDLLPRIIEGGCSPLLGFSLGAGAGAGMLLMAQSGETEKMSGMTEDLIRKFEEFGEDSEDDDKDKDGKRKHEDPQAILKKIATMLEKDDRSFMRVIWEEALGEKAGTIVVKMCELGSDLCTLVSMSMVVGGTVYTVFKCDFSPEDWHKLGLNALEEWKADQKETLAALGALKEGKRVVPSREVKLKMAPEDVSRFVEAVEKLKASAAAPDAAGKDA